MNDANSPAEVTFKWKRSMDGLEPKWTTGEDLELGIAWSPDGQPMR